MSRSLLLTALLVTCNEQAFAQHSSIKSAAGTAELCATDALITKHESLHNAHHEDGGTISPSFDRDPVTGRTLVEWQRVYDNVIQKMHLPPGEKLYCQLVVSGHKTYLLTEGVTKFQVDLDPKRQYDFYVEFFRPRSSVKDRTAPVASEFVNRTKVGLAQAYTSRIVDPHSFAAFEDTAIGLPQWFCDKYGLTSELPFYTVKLSLKKVVFIAKAETRAYLNTLPPGWRVLVNFDKQEKVSSVSVVDHQGQHIREFSRNAFYIKGDAAFNDNSFFWDDMFWSWSTAWTNRSLAEGTIEFWQDARQKHSTEVLGAIGGFTPRELRSDLSSFHYIEDRVFGQSRPNTELINPNLQSLVEWELYSLSNPSEGVERLTKAIDDVKGELDFIERQRSVVDKNGKPVPGGFWTSNLGSGMDNQLRCGGIENEAGYHKCAWIDMLGQHILQYQLLARMYAALGQFDKFHEAQAKALEYGEIMNRDFWSEEEGMYLDLVPDENGNLVHDRKNPSIATFWAMLTGMVPADRLDTFIKKNMTPERLGGDFPFPSLRRDDPNFHPDGEYWRGGHWANVMLIAAHSFEVNGHPELAYKYTTQIMARMTEASEEYHKHTGKWTVFEFMGEKASGLLNKLRGIPGEKKSDNYFARINFAGWGLVIPALGTLRHIVGLRPVPGFVGSDGAFARWLKLLAQAPVFKGTSYLEQTLRNNPPMDKVRQGYMEINLRFDPGPEPMSLSGINYQGYSRVHHFEIRKVSATEFEISVNSDQPFNVQLNRLFNQPANQPALGEIITIGGGNEFRRYQVPFAEAVR